MDKIRRIAVIIIIIAVVAVGAYLMISSNASNTNIDVLSNSTLQNGESVSFVLKDEFRNVLPDEGVDIKLLDESGSATKSSVVTDENGEGSMDLVGLENGNYTVHITYNGTMFHKDAKSVTTLVVDDGYSY